MSTAPATSQSFSISVEIRLLAAHGMQCPLDTLEVARDDGQVGFGRLVGLRAALLSIPQSSKRDPESCGKFLLGQRAGAGWRRLRTEESAVSRRESSCRGAESSRSMEESERPRSGGPDFRGAPPGHRGWPRAKLCGQVIRNSWGSQSIALRPPRTHPLEPARPFRGCRGDNLILHLRIAQLWSAAACWRFVAGQLAGRGYLRD
jgi:hypothetical protein